MVKTKNGITLIALVITIIVLLILAGVSISVITGDNGIVRKAKDAAEKTDSAAQEESGNLEQYEEYINSSVNGDSGDVDFKLKQYILGKDGNGVDFFSLIDSNMKFIDNSIMPNASEDISIVTTVMLFREEYNYVDIKFNDDIYRVGVDLENSKTTDLIKYEIKEVFVGNEEITEENLRVNLDIDELMVPWKKYLFEFSVNEESMLVTTIPLPVLISVTPGLYLLSDYGQTMLAQECSLLYDKPTLYFLEDYCVENSVVLKGIYDLGDSYYCYEENGNIILYYPNWGWALNTFVDESGIVPDTICGKEVEYIVIDGKVNETVIIDRPLKLFYGGDVINVEEIKLKINDLTWFDAAIEECNSLYEIVFDLTWYGDDVIIPDSIIEHFVNDIPDDKSEDEIGKIYVTEGAKERYQEYDFVGVR